MSKEKKKGFSQDWFVLIVHKNVGSTLLEGFYSDYISYTIVENRKLIIQQTGEKKKYSFINLFLVFESGSSLMEAMILFLNYNKLINAGLCRFICGS